MIDILVKVNFGCNIGRMFVLRRVRDFRWRLIRVVKFIVFIFISILICLRFV